jgi:hypothetical protein
MTDPISCTLAENALGYLILAGEQSKDKTPRMTTHALATLADGVELLLKARLEMRDWCLVFKDVDQASRSKYESGDFQSVAFDHTVKRLANLCAVRIADKHLAIVNELRQLRNRIRHFAVTTDEATAISLIVKTFSFAIEFVNEHLESIHEQLEDGLVQLRTLLGEFEEFVDERMHDIQAELDAAHLVVDCPVCLQPTLVPDAGESQCLFCRHRADGTVAARQWVDRFCGFQSYKDDLISPRIEQCPECGAEACIDMSDEETKHVCLSCGLSGEYEHCSSCGQLHSDDNPGDMCDDCWQDMLDRNP